MNEESAPPLLGHLDPEATPMVEDLLRAAAARIRTHLVNRIGTDLPITTVDTEWAPLASVLGKLASSIAVVACRIEPLGLDMMITLETDTLTRLVGQILGQGANSGWTGAENRPPSRFELVVARRIGEDVANAVAALLPLEGERRVVIEEVGTSTRVGLSLSRTSFVCATTYELQPPGDAPPGRVTVILPTNITRLAAPRRPARSAEGRMGMGRVLPLPVTVVAELRRVNLPLSQLREVKVGQMLDLGPAKDVVLRVGDRATLVGEAGIQNQARSVRVKARIEGEHIR